MTKRAVGWAKRSAPTIVVRQKWWAGRKRAFAHPTKLTDCLSGKSVCQSRLLICVCPVLSRKIIRFGRRANHLYKFAPSRPTEGRLAIVTDAGRDAVDAAALLTNSTKADGEVVWS
jgi:hypothetical protein